MDFFESAVSSLCAAVCLREGVCGGGMPLVCRSLAVAWHDDVGSPPARPVDRELVCCTHAAPHARARLSLGVRVRASAVYVRFAGSWARGGDVVCVLGSTVGLACLRKNVSDGPVFGVTLGAACV